MAIVLDTDVLIQDERGRFDLQRWVSSLRHEQFAIAAITVAELWHAVERAAGEHKITRQNYLRKVVGSLIILPYTEQTAYEHARIWVELEVAGKMIGFYDLIIGATALASGSRVTTFNKRHFAQIRGLSVVEPK